MIDDLLTDLAVGTVDRLASAAIPRDEADFGMARVNARLSTPHGEKSVTDAEGPTGPELNVHLLGEYLALGVEEMKDIAPAVHEWLLERLSEQPEMVSAETAEALRNLYLLFPDTTVCHAVVGVLMQAERGGRRMEGDGADRPLVSIIPRAIDGNERLSYDDRVYEMRRFVDLALDYIDVLPEQTERTLAALPPPYLRDGLWQHLLDWGERLGAEAGQRIRRVLGGAGGA